MEKVKADKIRQRFYSYLDKKGLKNTSQRKLMLDIVLEEKDHFNIDGIYQQVSKKMPNLGYATVYRTMKLFKEAGIVTSRNFDSNETQFEIHDEEDHHDHLICTKCGKIIEFYDPMIEKIQEDIAQKFGMELKSHKMELYGICNGKCPE